MPMVDHGPSLLVSSKSRKSEWVDPDAVEHRSEVGDGYGVAG